MFDGRMTWLSALLSLRIEELVSVHSSLFTAMSRQTSFLLPETEQARLERMQRYECELRQQGYQVRHGE